MATTILDNACNFVSSDAALTPFCCFEGLTSAWVFATDLKHKSLYSNKYKAPGKCVEFMDCSLMENREMELQSYVRFPWDMNQTREALLPLGHPCNGTSSLRRSVYIYTSVATAFLFALVLLLHLRKLRYVTALFSQGAIAASSVSSSIAATTTTTTTKMIFKGWMTKLQQQKKIQYYGHSRAPIL